MHHISQGKHCQQQPRRAVTLSMPIFFRLHQNLVHICTNGIERVKKQARLPLRSTHILLTLLPYHGANKAVKCFPTLTQIHICLRWCSGQHSRLVCGERSGVPSTASPPSVWDVLTTTSAGSGLQTKEVKMGIGFR